MNFPSVHSLYTCLFWLVSSAIISFGEPAIKVRIDPNHMVNRISPDFIGLGYETSAVAQAGYFSAKNETLVRLYRQLSPHGLIRIGGIISDHTNYIPDAALSVQTQNGTTIINKAALSELAEFARATGWSVMWGLNLGTGTKEEAVVEAQAVSEVLGDRLQSFEIGNEVDALRRFEKSYDKYHAAYLEYKKAIREKLPNAVFSGPDITGGGAISWVDSFAVDEAADYKLLTSHYYLGGAGDPRSTIERLLLPDGGILKQLEHFRAVFKKNRVPYRINETNSFFGGGKAGVSDTFASALWILDYLYILALNGAEGVNIETDINQLGFISHYSPIVHDPAGRCSVRPEYYGMLAFAMTGQGELLEALLENANLNLVTYATRDKEGTLWLTLINKDATRDAEIEAEIPDGYGQAEGFRLIGPSLESKDQVSFAGVEVGEDGHWSPGAAEGVAVENRTVHGTVKHASAWIIRITK